MKTAAASPRSNSAGVIVSIPPEYRDLLDIPEDGARVAIIPRESGPGVIVVSVADLVIGDFNDSE